MGDGLDQQRTVAIGTLVVGLVCFAVLAIVWVPWQPVPGGMPAPVPAQDVFTAGEIDRAEHYAAWARVWSWSSLVVSLAVACWLGFGRRGPELAARAPGALAVRVLLIVGALALAGRIATLPMTIAARKHSLDAGLSTSSWPEWTVDLLKAELLTVLTTTLALLLVIGCVRIFTRLWPAVLGLVLAGLVVAGSFAHPVVVEPLFNSFTVLDDSGLRAEIVQVAAAQGVEVDEVLVADASRRTTTLNAYVSGFGHTKRVVLYDTLLEQSPDDEVVAVVAHELAHAGHDDVVVGTLLGAAGAVVAAGALGWLMIASERRGRVGPGNPAAVPTILALVAVASIVVLPIQNGISRRIEARADVVALQSTDDPVAFIEMQERLARTSLADPTPYAFSQWLFGSHPTVLERVAIARKLHQLADAS